jgi:hypothetical protein
LKTFQDYYLKKDYSNALLSLEKSQKEIGLGLWHYNIGTVQAEMGNYSIARYHLLLAQEAGYSSKELRQNQRFVEEKLEIERLEKPLAPSDYVIKGALIASEGPLLTLALLAVVFGVWMIRKVPSLKNVGLLVLGTLIPLGLNIWIKSWPRQIVMESKQIYEGPSALFGERGDLPAGVVVITNKKEDWEEVIFPTRFSGWIRPDGLKKLELK